MEPTPEIDERDDAAPVGLSKDAADAVAILEWARRRGFQVPIIEIGAVKLRVTDLRQPKREGLLGDPDAPDDIYSEHERMNREDR